ncbi:MAG: glycosyltransferase [Bacteroidetes bacterium]|nr:glycosyltransferase [Bacteroidota bacterium]
MGFLLIASLLIAIAYAGLILSYAYFFLKPKSYNESSANKNDIKVSIIIPARNEADCILNLLESIKNQSYPSHLLEVVIVDDASTDDTYTVTNEFVLQHPGLNCKIIKLEDVNTTKTYKKHAISKAMELISGDLVVSTDADCIAGKDWIAEIVSIYKQTQAKMIVGLVAYNNDTTVFQKMQHLEFLSLIASGAAAVNSGSPIMCNGANLVYERKAFKAVNGFNANNQYASGDDVFLLLKIKKYFGKKSIVVADSKNAIVYTEAKKTLSEFTQQRIRWASKAKGYRDLSILFVAAVVFAFNFCIISTFILGFFNSIFFLASVFLFSIKLIVDFPVLFSICNYLNRKDLLLFYLPLQLLYLPYLLLIGTISNFVSYSWKGRKIET